MRSLNVCMTVLVATAIQPVFGANKGVPCEGEINRYLSAVSQPTLNEGKYKIRDGGATYSYEGFKSSTLNLRQIENDFERIEQIDKELVELQKTTPKILEDQRRKASSLQALADLCKCEDAERKEIRKTAEWNPAQENEVLKMYSLETERKQILKRKTTVDLKVCLESTCEFDKRIEAGLEAQRRLYDLLTNISELQKALQGISYLESKPDFAQQMKSDIQARLDKKMEDFKSQQTIVRAAMKQEPTSEHYTFSRIDFSKDKVFLYLVPGFRRTFSNPMPVVFDMATCKSDHTWASRCKAIGSATKEETAICSAEKAYEKKPNFEPEPKLPATVQ